MHRSSFIQGVPCHIGEALLSPGGRGCIWWRQSHFFSEKGLRAAQPGGQPDESGLCLVFELRFGYRGKVYFDVTVVRWGVPISQPQFAYISKQSFRNRATHCLPSCVTQFPPWVVAVPILSHRITLRLGYETVLKPHMTLKFKCYYYGISITIVMRSQ